MMKNKDQYAVAVRKPNQEIEVCVKEYHSMTQRHKLFRLPFIRGIFSFVDSMVLGIQTLTYSADFFLEETPEEIAKEEERKAKKAAKKAEREEKRKGKTPQSAATAEAGKEKASTVAVAEAGPEQSSTGMNVEAGTENSSPLTAAEEEVKKNGTGAETKYAEEDKKKDKDSDTDLLMIGTVIVSVVICVALFMMLPLFIAETCVRYIPFVTSGWMPVIEGVVKMLLFLGYLLIISRMEDIQRTFMYHGAEHKCINCIEHGMELNVENVRKSSRLHKRCGTSFLLFVMVISIIVFIFLNFESRILRYVVRLLCVPLIAGISYEFIRLAGNTENKVIGLLSKPGLAMQLITTSEPTDDMIEVAIAAVEAVFDWRAYLEEIKPEEG
ncbi:MAG: DUF1385 domain-containing protein [Lachnospiraceae bacterium]|nr:DUF1385 domain-containing protein [Lachnospiraceae bacterium]